MRCEISQSRVDSSIITASATLLVTQAQAPLLGKFWRPYCKTFLGESLKYERKTGVKR